MATIEDQKARYKNTTPPDDIPYYPGILDTLSNDRYGHKQRTLKSLVSIQRSGNNYAVMVKEECRIDILRTENDLFRIFHCNVDNVLNNYMPCGLEWDITELDNIGSEPISAEQVLSKYKNQPIEFYRPSKINMTHDPIKSPAHYTGGKIECIEAISEATKGLEGSEAYNTGAAMKYLWRWKRKNGMEDLKKARWHIEKLINDLENGNG